MRFRDRRHAGRELALRLDDYRGRTDVVVLGLPRGGIPVAYEVAQRLRAPLDVFVVRRLGVPGYEELAMGAIASGGVTFVNEPLVRQLSISESDIAWVAAAETRELERREALCRGGRPLRDVSRHTVILVDDGLAPGATMFAAVTALRRLGAARIVVGVPVSAPETCEALGQIVDEIVCAVTPEPFRAFDRWYQDFSETSDDEVRDLLARAAAELDPPPAGAEA
jgi:predicted phosphoribosyltransferase